MTGDVQSAERAKPANAGPEKQEQTKKKRSQTLRDGCSKAEPKIFAPPQTRFLGRGHGMV